MGILEGSHAKMLMVLIKKTQVVHKLHFRNRNHISQVKALTFLVLKMEYCRSIGQYHDYLYTDQLPQQAISINIIDYVGYILMG